jgi:hypothetical protein
MWPAARASFVFQALPLEKAHSKISILIIFGGLPAVIPSEFTSQLALMWPAARASFVFPALPHEQAHSALPEKQKCRPVKNGPAHQCMLRREGDSNPR